MNEETLWSVAGIGIFLAWVCLCLMIEIDDLEDYPGREV